MILIRISYFILTFSFLLGGLQEIGLNDSKRIQASKPMYTTDNSGNLLINVNIWGSSAGKLTVPEGANLIDILTLSGISKVDNDFKNVIILREYSDNNNNKIVVDLTPFFESGDRSTLIKIMPNDTIIIKQKWSYFMLDRIGELATVLSILSLAINLLMF